MPADPNVVTRRLEEFRRNLLDTSLRNRLINFSARTKAGKPLEKTVEVHGENPANLLRILVLEGKAMSFVGKPDPRPAKPPSDEIDDFGDPASLALFREEAEHEIDTFVGTGEAVVDANDLKLNTHETATALLRKLTKIHRDARTAVEEQGANVLFLALGALEWSEADASEEPRRAPLVLLPVNLERTNAGAFRLRWDGGDLGGNLSIAALVGREFGIRLPDLPDEPDLDAYFRDVARAVASKGRWSVDTGAVALGFFSYAKFLMYRDLDPAAWPEGAGPGAHETLGAMLDDGFEEGEPGVPEEAFLDPLRPTAEVCEVYDADGSQTLAILEANTGRTMLIEGPPGTGKSQTITNLIAEAIGAGRTVLFVAEKAAALDVVYRRLREANLEDACLELHSKGANKRGFYAELRRTVAASAPKASGAEADLKKLEEDRAALNDYAEAVNASLAPFGVSPRLAMGRLVALGEEGTAEGRHDFAPMALWTPEEFQERLRVVRGLQASVAAMGRPADHPFFGSSLTALLPADRDDLARSLDGAEDAVEALHARANGLAEALRVELPIRPADVERLREWAAFVAHAPDVRGVAVRADWAALEPSLREGLTLGRRADALRRETNVTPEAYGRDVASLRSLLGEGDLLLAEASFRFADDALALSRLLGLKPPTTLAEAAPLVALARRVASAPDLAGVAVSSGDWEGPEIGEALDAGTRVSAAHARYDAVLTPEGWRTSAEADAAILEAHGRSLLRFFNGAYKRAMAATAGFFVGTPPAPLERAAALRAAAEARDAEAVLARHRGRMASLFGSGWKGSDAAAAYGWIRENRAALPPETLVALERGASPAEIGRLGEALRVGTLDEDAYAWLTVSVRPKVTEIRALAPEGSLADALRTLDRVAEVQALRREIATIPPVLGPTWAAEDWNAAERLLDWTLAFRKAVDEARLPGGLVAFFAESSPRAGLDKAVREAQGARIAAQEAVRQVLHLARLDLDPSAFTEMPLDDQRDRIALWKARLESLPALIRFNALAADARERGLEESVLLATDWPGAGTRLAEAFERSYYTGIVRAAGEARPILRLFERATQEGTVAEFQTLDTLALRHNRVKVALTHWRSVPRSTAGGAMGWLGVQFGLSRSHKPIRTAMAKAGAAVQAIKPVFLMSPLSVATFLPADGPRFDVVIFDEASQVKPEDAFGGILRATQTVVVGDSKQMPPTSFFDKLTSEEDDDEDDDGSGLTELESVLAMMSAKLPAKSPRRRDLRWHYRSRHDALIATSNRLFYDDRLVVFPSPERAGANAGLVLRHDPTTVYGRGGTRKNAGEAHAVALAAQRHVRESPELTLGIAAFSKAQQEAIQDEIDLLRRAEPAFAAFDAAHPFEPLFVKNLENVQGDERDVILISVGYGRDENGYVPASFGPLNREGGERRLNVLITRARVRCEVFTNLRAEDLRMTDRPPLGVQALRTFLAFAETGRLDVPSATGREPQSPFEEAVLQRLRNAGYDVEPQVGSCGFFIDLAVRHPEIPGRFVLGIECDGAMYHSARTARDRDKLRQQVLESRGWRIHRIWSTDWFANADREFARLTEAIAQATAGVETPPPPTLGHTPLERDETLTIVEETIPPYRIASPDVALGNLALHEVTPTRMADWVVSVVEIEGPVHGDEALRRIREAAGVARAGEPIRKAFQAGCALASRQGRIRIDDEFLRLPNKTPGVVRNRADLPSSRKLELIAPEEIEAALDRVIRPAFGIAPEEAFGLAARLLGFERTTGPMAERFREVSEEAVAQGRFTHEGGLLRSAGIP